MSLNAFGKRVGLSSSQVSRIVTGQRTPPLDLIESWADALELKGAARDEFVELANLAHCPEFIQERYTTMRDRQRR